MRPREHPERVMVLHRFSASGKASGVDLGRIGAECDRDRAIADVRPAPEDVASPA